MQTPKHSELPAAQSHDVKDCLRILDMLEAVYDRQIQEYDLRIEQLKSAAQIEDPAKHTVDFSIQPRRAA